MLKRNTRKWVRRICLAATAAMVVLFLLNYMVVNRKYDSSVPEISFAQEMLEVSVAAEREELLEGVMATDAKDGDVTDSIIIESISKMLDDGSRIVTYVAFDGDNHVGKAERKVHYTDYRKPYFTLDEPLAMSSMFASQREMLAPLHAVDVIDGDITGNIIITDSELMALSEDSASETLTVQVTNSCGDVVELALPVKLSLEDPVMGKALAEIALTEYLVYCPVGQEPDWRVWLDEVTCMNEAYGAEDVQVDTSQLNLAVPGVYPVVYQILDEEAEEPLVASVDLLVVVEE